MEFSFCYPADSSGSTFSDIQFQPAISSIEKSISVSKLGDDGEVVEIYEGDQDELSELIPNSKLLN